MDVLAPGTIALVAALAGTGGLWVIGAYAWLLFALPAAALGSVALWYLRSRHAKASPLRLAVVLSIAWIVSGVIALALNIGLAVAQQGGYEPGGLGTFWFIWILCPISATLTTVIRSAYAARSRQ